MEITKIHISYDDIVKDINDHIAPFKCIDCVVGIARGGVIPATVFAYKLNIKDIYFTQLSSYDSNNKQTSLYEKLPLSISHILNKNVLFVDDIADSGNTLNYINKVYSRYVKEAKFYTCVYKARSVFKPDFYGRAVDDYTWVNFPWEA